MSVAPTAGGDAPPVSRMFAAVAWRGGEAAPLLDLQALLRSAPGAAAWRWMAPEDLHLTLRFHGDATPAQAEATSAELARLARAGQWPPIRFERLDAWPGVLVARFAAAPPLHASQAALERHAIGLGFAAEARPWAPHVTLARMSREQDVELPRIKLAPFELPLSQLALFRRAGEGASRYARIATFDTEAS